jgi:PadR family transcriptional regulator PadR
VGFFSTASPLGVIAARRRWRSRPDTLPRKVSGRTVVRVGKQVDDRVREAASGTIARLRRELARGTTELAVLAVLDAGRRYGYELLKVLQQAGEGALDVREGTLYPLLHRLEDSGHITATWEAEGRARPRKYYALTPEGRSYLALLRGEWSGLVDGMRRLLDTLGEVGT